MFDVFLAHNSKDKPQVRAIAEELKRRKLKPWLDDEQIPPGRLFQNEIQKAIPQILSAAICIGSHGLGIWQVIELQTLISQFVNKGSPIIPILLPGVEEIPSNLLFLQQFHSVNFNKIDDPAAFYQLEWGITGIKPQPRTIVTESSLQSTFEPEALVSQPRKQSSNYQIHKFEIVTVNDKGEEISRKPGQAQYFTEDLGNNIALDIAVIPGGKFFMGTEDEEIARLCKKYDNDWFENERPRHEVKISPFLMGKYPITQAQWQEIASRTDLKVERDLKLKPVKFPGDKLPVERVSWYDAVEFCQRLSKQTGKEYRLPSEAEWEYACRAGTTTPFHFGETITSDLVNYDANYTYAEETKGKYREQTTPVGSFPPNAFGLYDMHGNVWEWCVDDWQKNYEDAPNNGNAWLSENSIIKIIRGGSWNLNPLFCRSAIRGISSRVDRSDGVGFRVACVFPRTT